MARGHLLQFRSICKAFWERIRATRLERATDRRAHHIRRLAFDWCQTALARFIEPRDRRQEPGRIWMKGVMINCEGRSVFDNRAGVHHIDPLGVTGNDTQVVGDEDQRHAHFVRDSPDEFKEL